MFYSAEVKPVTEKIKASGHRRLIEAVIDQTEISLIAEVTEDATAELKLAVGSNRSLVIDIGLMRVCL